MVGLKDIKQGFVINLDTFFRNPIKEDVKDGSIIVETVKVVLDDGRTVFNKKFYSYDKEILEEVTKKAATETITMKLEEYLVDNRTLPPNVKSNKFLKNGKVKMFYDPESYTKFSITLPAKFADIEKTTDFIIQLEENKDQNRDNLISDITDEFLMFINDKTFYLNKMNRNLEKESLIFKSSIKEFSDGERKAEKSYYIGTEENNKQQIDLTKFEELLTEKMIDYMKNRGTWTPFTERIPTKEETSDQIKIVYNPDKFNRFILKFPQKIDEQETEKFLDNLQLVERSETNLYWKVEKAKSARSTCKGCNEKIDKGELRIGKPYIYKEHVTHKWYHVDCARRGELVMDEVKGLEELSEEDIEELKLNKLLEEE